MLCSKYTFISFNRFSLKNNNFLKKGPFLIPIHFVTVKKQKIITFLSNLCLFSLVSYGWSQSRIRCRRGRSPGGCPTLVVIKVSQSLDTIAYSLTLRLLTY